MRPPRRRPERRRRHPALDGPQASRAPLSTSASCSTRCCRGPAATGTVIEHVRSSSCGAEKAGARCRRANDLHGAFRPGRFRGRRRWSTNRAHLSAGAASPGVHRSAPEHRNGVPPSACHRPHHRGLRCPEIERPAGPVRVRERAVAHLGRRQWGLHRRRRVSSALAVQDSAPGKEAQMQSAAAESRRRTRRGCRPDQDQVQVQACDEKRGSREHR